MSDPAAPSVTSPRQEASPSAPLVLVWHHHQPLYRDLTRGSPRGSYRQPWVRLHALRDYHGMAAQVARHPHLRVTFNFSAGLLWQIEDYVDRGATDEALELSLIPAARLDEAQRTRLVATFFAAESPRHVLAHPRYRELFEARAQGAAFSPQELCDLQIWFSLSWFPPELREGPVALCTGETVDVSRFFAAQRGFRARDVEELAEAQLKLMRAIIPLHRQLQQAGRIEISVSPFFHPILPLLLDTGAARIDRPGAALPRPFRHAEDAEAQVQLAVAAYQRWFGRRPRGMWPAEGAISPSTIPVAARAGLAWLASDEDVLAASGRWGYEAHRPEVRSRIYRVRDPGTARDVALLFRDRGLADELGFRCHTEPDEARAAAAWCDELEARARAAATAPGPSAVTVVLDGENAWGHYRQAGRPFLASLYAKLDRPGATTTPGALLAAAAAALPEIEPLATGSWIDEPGSAAGVDLGTWIGEPDENRAWELLGEARDALARSGATPTGAPDAFRALHAAEGSDWFWWYGSDQSAAADPAFDELFRAHLRAVYLALGLPPPATLSRPVTAAGPG